MISLDLPDLADASAAAVRLGAGHFGHRTLRHQDTSAPQNWCRSVRTLRDRYAKL